MAGINGLGALGSGDFLQNLRGGGRLRGGDALTPGGGVTGQLQVGNSTTTSRAVSMSGMSAQFGELLSANASPQQTQMIQALVTLMILIALLEQLQQGQQSGGKLLDALSSGRGTGQAPANSSFASSYVAYEQTTVTLTLSSGDAGAAGDPTGNQGQIDVTA